MQAQPTFGKTQSARRPQKQHRDAIDTEPLTGRVRNEFQASLYAKVKGMRQLVLRILLDYAGGTAECWVGNGKIAEIAGKKVRYIQVILAKLEEDGIILRVEDRSLTTQRRIVILDHPNAVQVLARSRPSAVDAARGAPGCRETARNGAPGAHRTVHPGAQKPLHPRAHRSPANVPSGSSSETRVPFFSRHRERPQPLTIEAQRAVPRFPDRLTRCPMTITIPSAKLTLPFKAGQLPAIDPANPRFTLDLGGVNIRAEVTAKAARKLAAHAGRGRPHGQADGRPGPARAHGGGLSISGSAAGGTGHRNSRGRCAMTPDQLHAALSTAKRPFRPFRLRLVDGQTAAVDDPGCWCISPSGSYLVYADNRGVHYTVTADQVEAVLFIDADEVDQGGA